jgi:hypothetical protein
LVRGIILFVNGIGDFLALAYENPPDGGARNLIERSLE